MEKKFLNRIITQTGNKDILDILSKKLSFSDLQSLLLEVFSKKASKITPSQLLSNYQNNPHTFPSEISPIIFMKLDAAALKLLPVDFTPVELSPVAPLGTCAAVSNLDQKRIVSTIRNSEVVSDTTNVLALECAKRRKQILRKDPKSSKQIKLCASHRLLRGQSFNDPKYSQHFRIFTLCTAGRDTGSLDFERQNLQEHINFYLNFIKNILNQINKSKKLSLFITDLEGGREKWIQDNLFIPLEKKHPDCPMEISSDRKSGIKYYRNFCFNISIDDETGNTYDFLVDGGFNDWTQLLMANNKERLLTSGLGTELFIRILGI